MKITKKWFIVMIAGAFFLAASGCASQGEMRGQTTGTSVQLTKNNYKVIAPGAMGKSYGFNLLGFIPIVSPSYAQAKKELYQNSGESLAGKPIALANQTEDRSSLYLILFSIPRVTITADIVEFTPEVNNTPQVQNTPEVNNSDN